MQALSKSNLVYNSTPRWDIPRRKSSFGFSGTVCYLVKVQYSTAETSLSIERTGYIANIVAWREQVVNVPGARRFQSLLRCEARTNDPTRRALGYRSKSEYLDVFTNRRLAAEWLNQSPCNHVLTPTGSPILMATIMYPWSLHGPPMQMEIYKALPLWTIGKKRTRKSMHGRPGRLLMLFMDTTLACLFPMVRLHKMNVLALGSLAPDVQFGSSFPTQEQTTCQANNIRVYHALILDHAIWSTSYHTDGPHESSPSNRKIARIR